MSHWLVESLAGESLVAFDDCQIGTGSLLCLWRQLGVTIGKEGYEKDEVRTNAALGLFWQTLPVCTEKGRAQKCI